MQLILDSFSDPTNCILPASAYLTVLYNRPIYVDTYLSHLIDNIMFKLIIYPLADSIENILRHRILARNIDEMPILNPKESPLDQFMKLLDLPPIMVCGMAFSIKTAVERTLEKSLYNSSTVGLKDTNSHIEMAVLARNYGLHLIDNHLPAGTAEQGMDIIHIVDHLEGKCG